VTVGHSVLRTVCDALVSNKTFWNATTHQKLIRVSYSTQRSTVAAFLNVSKRSRRFANLSRIATDSVAVLTSCMPQTDPQTRARRLFDARTLFFATFFFSMRFQRPCYLYWTLCRSLCGGAYLGRAAKIGLRRCWGVVQLVGHLTVNEAGEGSNPSAPAIFLSGNSRQNFSGRCESPSTR
jgi:hypothetical protein